MILIRYNIYAKVFFSITIISNFLLRKSIPALISNNHSLPSTIKIQQIGSPSIFLSPITVKCFYFSVAFFCAIQIFSQIAFSTPIWPSPVMSIFPPKFSPRSTMSGQKKDTFYFTARMTLIQIQLDSYPCLAITIPPISSWNFPQTIILCLQQLKYNK